MATHTIPPHVGDDSGFERLYRVHVEDIHRYALAITRNRSDAEDVTQTTFMNAYRAYERGERPRAAQNWLMTIAHNVYRQHTRNSARRPREVELNAELAETPAIGSDAPTAADIRRAVLHLSPDEQTVIVIRELQGGTNAEIAEALDMTIAATERLVFRARRSLREQLAETLTCLEAEAAINRKLDGESSRVENAALRLHLRECSGCAHRARTYRAQRSLLRKIGTAASPTSLLPATGLAPVGPRPRSQARDH
jgi:RNA polymerase sigma-70 factor (ECF subfamily)